MVIQNKLFIIALCCFFISPIALASASSNVLQTERPRFLTATTKNDTDDSASKDEYPSSSNVNISSTFIDSQLEDIIWCGNDVKHILVLTSKGTVYLSSDQGQEWNKLHEVFQRTGKREVTSDEDVGDVAQMLQSPVNSKLIIFLGTAGVNWLSEDCGQNVRAINSGMNIKEYKFHPNEPNWVLASAFTTCEDFSDEPCKIYKELYHSKDLGATWNFVADYVIQFDWGTRDHFPLQLVPTQRIVISHLLEKKGNQKLKGWSEKAEIAFSDDYFKTKTVVIDSGNKFLITDDYFFAVQVDDEEVQNVKLYVGNPDAKIYDLKPVVLPQKKSKKKKKKENEILEHSYTILDTSEGQVFLHINHEGERSKYGNVYISDSTGQRYSLSAHNNARSGSGQCDFEKVAGLEGIYLLNIYDAQMIAKLKDDFSSDEEIPTSQSSSKPTGKTKAYQAVSSSSKDKDKRFKELEQYKQTLISFDKGAIWEPLKPPKNNVKGEKIECDKDDSCSLHLHSISNTKFGPFYSTDNSLGIVLGVGNVGKYLSNKEDEVNTYLSRNGGLNWFEVLQGSHIYEIGDHGAIIVAAPDQEATKVLYYTWNEGLTWDTVTISEKPIQVTNIIIEPTNTAEHFIVYGRTSMSSKDSNNNKEPKGVIISVDFASLHERICLNPDNPNDPNSDYETWSPNGAISANCLMGHQTTYVRRKREAQCFNSEQFDRWYSSKNCECTEEDWECDIGYERTKEGPCQKQTNELLSYDPPTECEGDFYFVSTGYRKVAGNTCEGGVNHEGIKLPCPGNKLARSHVFALIIICGVIAALCFLSNKGYSQSAKDFAHSLGEKAKAAAGARNNSKFDKKGFKQFNEGLEADSYNDDDGEGLEGKLRFDDRDEPTKQRKDNGKKMAGRSGLDTAQKNIPMISKPGKGFDDNEREMSDI